MAKSFYDLDFIIEINEKSVEQYTTAYQQVLSKLTNIILIYSAVAIFLIPIIREVFLPAKNILLYSCFGGFCILFLISIAFTIKLIFPIEVAYLSEPGKYYKQYRIDLETKIANHEDVDKSLKASYIIELEKAVLVNDTVFKRKSSFITTRLCLDYYQLSPSCFVWVITSFRKMTKFKRSR